MNSCFLHKREKTWSGLKMRVHITLLAFQIGANSAISIPVQGYGRLDRHGDSHTHTPRNPSVAPFHQEVSLKSFHCVASMDFRSLVYLLLGSRRANFLRALHTRHAITHCPVFAADITGVQNALPAPPLGYSCAYCPHLLSPLPYAMKIIYLHIFPTSWIWVPWSQG